MPRGKTDLDKRPNTLEENKSVLWELQSRNKIDHKSLHETNKLIAKFNAKNGLRFSKNVRASFETTRQEKITDNHYGPVDGFPSGSWWGIRMDCSRDRVHCPFNEDICEGPFGATSLCTPRLNTHNDIDLGDYLTFTSVKHVPGDQKSPNPLLKNYHNRLPLRLIRSYNLTSDYAPKTGYRYDGLYAIVECWISVTSDELENYKFALARLRHQEPPIWQLAEKSSLSDAKNFKISHTRRSPERFSIDPSDDTKNRSNNEKSKRKARSRSSAMRCSLRNFNVARGDSAIVTRCISKKSDAQMRRGMVSVPYPEASLAQNNRLLLDSKNPTLCKLQNTNISIRTDLYDSSNVIQQETRKTTPMTFCRTYKNSRLSARTMNHSNVVSLNLNSCGPCPRDNDIQESLIQSRSGIVKFSSDQSPSLPDHSNDRSTPKSFASILSAKTKINLDDKRKDCPASDETADKIIIEPSNEMEQNSLLEVAPIDAEMRLEKISSFAGKTSNNAVASIDESSISHAVSASSSPRDETTVERLAKESPKDLDSLTPDQMLNFIVKQKYHPTAKLLIGSVIGLATGETTIMRAYESLMARKSRRNSEKTAKNENNEIMTNRSIRGNDENSPPIVDSRDYANERNSTSENKRIGEMSIGKILPNKIILRDSEERLMRKMKLRRTRVSVRLLGSDEESSSSGARSSSVAKCSRKSGLTEIKAQKPFSKLTLSKKSKKRAKKRRGELANLFIDANIGPIVRGPRNRRLRCGMGIFAKKRKAGKEIATNRCNERVGSVARADRTSRKKEITRIDLSTRKTRLKAVKSQISESHFVDKRKIISANTTNHRQDRIVDVGVDDAGKFCTKNQSIGGKKRKLSRSSSHESVETRNILSNDKLQNIDSARLRMIDATTQCSTSRRDAATSVDREIINITESDLSRNTIKLEWIDVDDVKSEICENYEISEESSSDEINDEREQNFRDKLTFLRSQTATGSRIDDSTTRSSAFVPVKISDDDSRIKRLRSIGFRPIKLADDSQNVKERRNASEESFPAANSSLTTGITCRDVDELFKKYTSEETASVAYMDQELRYEDIEDEFACSARKSKKIVCGTARRGRRGGKIMSVRTKKIETPTRDREGASNEEDSEVPWHGWKKFVKNKQAQWIGW